MGKSKFSLEGLVLTFFLKKIRNLLYSAKIYLSCLILTTVLASACVDYIELDEENNTTIPANSDLEIKVFEEINKYRESKELGKLINSEVISKVARLHSDNMATGSTGFGHIGFDERFDCICEDIENASGMAENVAHGYLTAESVSEGWVSSIGHKKNIEGDYTHTGVGIAKSKDGTIYFTQIFVKVEK